VPASVLKNLAVLAANHADRVRKSSITLIVSRWFPLRERLFLRQYIAFAGSEKEICLDTMLFAVEVAVAAARSIQRLVRPAFDDAAGFDDEDLICATNCGQPVGDNKGGAPAHQIAQPLLNERLRFRIKTGSSFVED
jgi:hypothetical protein